MIGGNELSISFERAILDRVLERK